MNGTIPAPMNPLYLRLVKDFENIAAAYRDMRLHGPANDAEARKSACEWLADVARERAA